MWTVRPKFNFAFFSLDHLENDVVCVYSFKLCRLPIYLSNFTCFCFSCSRVYRFSFTVSSSPPSSYKMSALRSLLHSLLCHWFSISCYSHNHRLTACNFLPPLLSFVFGTSHKIGVSSLLILILCFCLLSCIRFGSWLGIIHLIEFGKCWWD